jgi:hypothetical protein
VPATSKSNSGSSKARTPTNGKVVVKSYWETGPGNDKFKCPRHLNTSQEMRGFEMRRSNAWLDAAPIIERQGIPLISRLGKFTGHDIASWDCTPAQWLGSVVATIASRLRLYTRKHNHGREVSRYLRTIVRVSGYYALTNNSYLMDRVLYFLRNLKERGHLIHKTLLKFLSKMDVNKRFVYSQVSYQTNWLLFRAAARPRDKSKFIYKVVPTRSSSFIGIRSRRTSEDGRHFLSRHLTMNVWGMTPPRIQPNSSP